MACNLETSSVSWISENIFPLILEYKNSVFQSHLVAEYLEHYFLMPSLAAEKSEFDLICGPFLVGSPKEVFGISLISLVEKFHQSVLCDFFFIISIS